MTPEMLQDDRALQVTNGGEFFPRSEPDVDMPSDASLLTRDSHGTAQSFEPCALHGGMHAVRLFEGGS